ncbi:hypothetical protein NQZ68_025746, partial [Dissostichus eleginoides]
LAAYNPDERARWEHWTKEDVVVGNKTYQNWVKKTENGTVSKLVEEFIRELDAIAIHHFNWLHQAQKFRQLKDNLRENEIRAHGKGAPDGVGGAVKRMADNHVYGGKDLQNPKDLYEFLINREVENIRIKWIDESDINIYYRDLSCFCQYPEMCECFKPTKMRMDDSSNANSDHLQPDSIQKTYAESPSTDVEKNEEYTITKLLLDNIEINCMVQHGKRNVFKWPNKPDCIFYHRQQIASVISEPEPNQQPDIAYAYWLRGPAAGTSVTAAARYRTHLSFLLILAYSLQEYSGPVEATLHPSSWDHKKQLHEYHMWGTLLKQ